MLLLNLHAHALLFRRKSRFPLFTIVCLTFTAIMSTEAGKIVLLKLNYRTLELIEKWSCRSYKKHSRPVIYFYRIGFRSDSRSIIFSAIRFWFIIYQWLSWQSHWTSKKNLLYFIRIKNQFLSIYSLILTTTQIVSFEIKFSLCSNLIQVGALFLLRLGYDELRQTRVSDAIHIH